jgi:hypothetical protein
VKVVGFMFRDEDEAHLQRLSAQLGWNRSQVIRALLRQAVVQEPTIRVMLPPLTEAEIIHAS